MLTLIYNKKDIKMNYSNYDDFYSKDKDMYFEHQNKLFTLKHKPIINKLKKLEYALNNFNVLNVYDAKKMILISKEVDRIKNHLQHKANFIMPFDC